MAKVNQVIAIEKGVKSKAMGELTELYYAMQKPDSFNGIARKYTPNDAEGEQLPAEGQLVQRTAPTPSTIRFLDEGWHSGCANVVRLRQN